MKTISLDGEWRLKYSTGQRGAWHTWPREQKFLPDYPATVPGTVQQAMEALTGDVTRGHASLDARWLEEMLWNYSRVFTLSEEDAGKRVRLVFEGLDLTANVFVNGKHIGGHNNFYTPCRLDVTGLVQPGENRLSVNLDSGLFYAAKKPIAGLCGEGEPQNQVAKRMWLRKPQSSFEWDWSPRLINVGIYKSCRVEITNGIFADEQAIFATLNDDYSEGGIRIRQFLYNNNNGLAYTVSARVVETGDTAEVSGSLPAGNQCVELKLSVKQPKLWYPVNYGEQHRYTVEITIKQEGAEDIVITKKTAFRQVVIDQSKHPEAGYYFNLIVNGVKVFAKGANMVPADIIYSRLTRDVYETLIDRAVEANFNMLRVWGGGLYETDDFYELCDERGLMVWQDFINACASYPGYDDEYFQNYRSEIIFAIRRLSRFASLVIYAGNNELIWLTANYGGQHYPDAQLYHWLIPKMLRAEGEERYYQPSSPYSFDSTDDNSDIVGDQHPWFIGFSDRDYFKYRGKDGRFPNEGGMLGPTSLPNMMACFSEGQDYMHSFDWEVHDNSIASGENQSPDLMITEHMGIDTKGMSVRDYTYYGGFCQGEGFTEYILNFRRRMHNTSSAIFWMYNDCWPATRSWTIVDYLRNRTPAFYPVKRSFAPVAVDIVKDGNELVFYGINERTREVSAELEYGAFTVSGVYETHKLTVTLPANASTALARIALPEAGNIPYAELRAEGEPVSRRRFVECGYDKLGLEKCEIKIERSGSKAIYTADKLVLGVCLDLDGDTAIGDNFFDLYPGKPYEVELAGKSGDILYAYMG